MMVAAYSTHKGDVLNPDLLSLVLKKEAARRRELIPDGEACQKMENLATLATLVGGLRPRSNGFAFLAATEITALISNADLVAMVRDKMALGSAGCPAARAARPKTSVPQRPISRIASPTGMVRLTALRNMSSTAKPAI